MDATLDERFFDTAPTRFVDTIEIARPAAAVWAELSKDKPLDWCRALDITWKSPRPFGVGTLRQAKVLGVVLVLHEEFVVWEEGRRMAFLVHRAVPPMFSAFGEDYLVEPLGEDRCRFTWTLAAVPNALGRLAAPVNTLIVRSLFADTRRFFSR